MIAFSLSITACPSTCISRTCSFTAGDSNFSFDHIAQRDRLAAIRTERLPLAARSQRPGDLRLGKVPLGTIENSPAIHRWDNGQPTRSSPRRAKENMRKVTILSFVFDGTHSPTARNPSDESAGYFLPPSGVAPPNTRSRHRRTLITSNRSPAKTICYTGFLPLSLSQCPDR
jgi:hypothetical protein